LAAASGLPGQAARSAGKLMQLLSRHDEPEIVATSARLLLGCADREVLPALRARVKGGSVAINRRLVPLLGICADADDHRLIAGISTAQPEILPECIAALGLLGSPQVIGHLISQLSDPSQRQVYLAAVIALRCISGQEWFPDFDTEEAQPADVVRFQETWRAWSSQSGGRLQPNTRYRLGLPLSPAALVADLGRKGNPHRDLSFLELKYRYGCSVDFQHNARYSIQVTQLKKIEDWRTSIPANRT